MDRWIVQFYLRLSEFYLYTVCLCYNYFCFVVIFPIVVTGDCTLSKCRLCSVQNDWLFWWFRESVFSSQMLNILMHAFHFKKHLHLRQWEYECSYCYKNKHDIKWICWGTVIIPSCNLMLVFNIHLGFGKWRLEKGTRKGVL